MTLRTKISWDKWKNTRSTFRTYFNRNKKKFIYPYLILKKEKLTTKWSNIFNAYKHIKGFLSYLVHLDITTRKNTNKWIRKNRRLEYLIILDIQMTNKHMKIVFLSLKPK